MNTPKTIFALSFSLLMASAANAADVRLYPNFAEVSVEVEAKGDAVQVQFDPNQAVGLRSESIHLSGLPFKSMQLSSLPSWLEQQVGKPAFFQEMGRAVQRVTIARVEGGQVWVRDAAGSFKSVNASNLFFNTLPPEQHTSGSGVQAVFHLQNGEANKGQLSYTNHRISWTPRYVLGVQGENAHLEAWAHIQNNTPLEQKFQGVELFAGEVNTQSSGPMYRAQAMPEAMVLAAPAVATDSSMQEMESLNGVYRYELKEPLTLPKNSLTVHPFMTTQIKEFVQVGTFDDYFSTRTARGTLERLYRVVAADNLPAGVVAVREDDRLVGEAQLPQTAAGEKAEFMLGKNPNALYERSIRSITKHQHEVTYTFTNRSKQALPVEAKLTISHHQEAKLLRADEGITIEGGEAILKTTVPAGEKVTLSFTFSLPEDE